MDLCLFQGDDEDLRQIKILRNTACSQSLIISGVLPHNTKSDESTVARGIEMGFVPVPLHRVHVRSETVIGFFKVGVRADFPINGIDVIMENDMEVKFVLFLMWLKYLSMSLMR